jgi:hypothetical protein
VAEGPGGVAAVRQSGRATASLCPSVRLSVVAAFLLVTSPGGLLAQGAGAEGPVVLQTQSSVRGAGFNGAGVALTGDAGAVFHNPAALATIRHIALEAGYYQAPFDAYQTTAAFAWRLGQFDFGAGLKYFDFGSEPEVVPDPATGGVGGTETGAVIQANEFLAVGSLIYRFGIIAFGGSGKYLRQRVADLDQRGISGDLGLAIAFFDIMALGFAVQNLSGNWEGESDITMPRMVRAGFTMNYVDPQETYRLLSTLEMQWPEGRGSRFVFGLEGGIVFRGIGLLGRAAYGSRPIESDRSRMTYGFSVNLTRLTIDYAYEPTDLLVDTSQRIGLRLTL